MLYMLHISILCTSMHRSMLMLGGCMLSFIVKRISQVVYRGSQMLILPCRLLFVGSYESWVV